MPVAVAGPSPGFANMKWLRPVTAGETISYFTKVTGTRQLARPGWGMIELFNTGLAADGAVVFSFEGRILAHRAGRINARVFYGRLAPSPRKDRPPEPLCEPFQRDASEMRIARCVEARRPHGNRGFAGCDGQDAAADAALSGKADPVGKFPGAVIVAAGQHHRVDAPRAFGVRRPRSRWRDCGRDGRETVRPSLAAGRTSRWRSDGSRRRA